MSTIDLAKERTKRRPHLMGEAACMQCAHEWTAVAPTGANWLQCPECGSIKGHFKHPCYRDGSQHWGCQCGCELFLVAEGVIYCPQCGETKGTVYEP